MPIDNIINCHSRAVWAIMRLQIVPEDIGGAGRNKIEWEFDDAVLRETGQVFPPSCQRHY
jgi:hypothetical protein